MTQPTVAKHWRN